MASRDCELTVEGDSVAISGARETGGNKGKRGE